MANKRRRCDEDCFNCKYSDCIKNDVSWEDYIEIKSREEKKRTESDKGGWNARHPEKIKEYKKKYHFKNQDSENAKSRDYYYKHREEILERNKTDYMRDYKKKKMREYRQRLRDRVVG